MAKKIKAIENKLNIQLLESIYKEISEDKQSSARLLIDQAEYLIPQIERAKKDMASHDLTDWFEQGSQKFYRKSPFVDVYTQLIRTYASLLKDLVSLLPKDTGPKEDTDDFDNFINKR